MAKAISNEIRKQALELFKKGLRSQAVAQMLAIDRTVVREWQSAFDRGDYSWTTYVRRKSSEAIALTAVSLYTELKSYHAVAHQLGGMKASTVRRYVLNVEKYGIPILPKGRGGKAKLQALIQGDSLMSKCKTKPRSRSMNAIKKERDEYKIALECLLESIQEKYEDDEEGLKKKVRFLAGQLKDHVKSGLPLPVSVASLASREVPFIEKLEALVEESRKIQLSVLESKLSKKNMGTATG